MQYLYERNHVPGKQDLTILEQYSLKESLTLYEMMELSYKLNTPMKAYEAEISVINEEFLPLIFLTFNSPNGSGHYRILIRRDFLCGSWLVFEPMTLRKYWITHENLIEQWSGYILIFESLLLKGGH